MRGSVNSPITLTIVRKGVEDTPNHILRLRTQGPLLEPEVELLEDGVVHLMRRDAPSSAKVRKGGQTARQPLVIGNEFEEGSPGRVL